VEIFSGGGSRSGIRRGEVREGIVDGGGDWFAGIEFCKIIECALAFRDRLSRSGDFRRECRRGECNKDQQEKQNRAHASNPPMGHYDNRRV
jgi:hypothetical protein